MFNLQSGIHRQRFPAPRNARQVKLEQLGAIPESKRKVPYARERHSKEVTGLAVDSVNRTVVSCGLDGKLKVSSGFDIGRSSANVVFSSGISSLGA